MAPAQAAKKKEYVRVTMPTGRMINGSLFERDVFKDENGKEGEPNYKIEVAYDPNDVEGERTIEDDIIEACCREWGDRAEQEYLDGKIRVFLDGNNLALARKEKGKDGGAYQGKLILRAATKFNKDGIDGPGGVAVFDEDVKPVDVANQGAVYPGCMVQIVVTLKPYISSFGGNKAIKAYLEGVQKVGDGERLVTKKEVAGAFKPVGRAAGSSRRSRAG